MRTALKCSPAVGILLAALFILSGCPGDRGVVGDADSWNLGASQQPYGLLVLTDTSLRDYRWDAGAMKFVPGPAVAIEANWPTDGPRPLRMIQRSAGHVLVCTPHDVLYCDANLQPMASRTFPKVGAIAFAGKTPMVAAEGKLLALDGNLRTTGELDLLLDWKEKNAHDILVDGNTAYLLDNIVYPCFVFRVDVSDPARMTILQKTDIVGVNAHLPDQWVDKSLGCWFVMAVHANMAEWGQHLVPFSLGKKDDPNEVFLFEEKKGPRVVDLYFAISDGNVTGKAMRLLDGCPRRLWAVTDSPNHGGPVLNRFQFDGKRVTLTPVWALPDDYVARGMGRWLFVAVDILSSEGGIFVPTLKPRVLLIRADCSPQFQVATPLDGLGGSRVLDVLPY